jgi:ribosomal protein S18 acetylase RimI-like enzyme
VDFKQLQSEHIEQVAKLHTESISSGFISSLGIDFVITLYEAIAQSKSSFGFVAQEANKKIVGFVAFTVNINKLYKSLILRKGLRFGLLLAGKMLSLQRLKRVLETLFYPGRIKNLDLPSAELLSIGVAENHRGKGIGLALVEMGFKECARRNIEKVKALVGADREVANKLYLKCGFKLVGQIENHGELSNIYVAETRKKRTDKKPV